MRAQVREAVLALRAAAAGRLVALAGWVLPPAVLDEDIYARASLEWTRRDVDGCRFRHAQEAGDHREGRRLMRQARRAAVARRTT